MDGSVKPYKCDFCSKKYVRKGNLNNHIRNKHKELKEEQEKEQEEEQEEEQGGDDIVDIKIDNKEGLEFLKNIDDNTINLVLTDPPYITSRASGMNNLYNNIENNNNITKTEEEWDETGVIKGSFPETAFDKNGKFQVYVMDKIRALAASQSQDVNLIFISHDGETASMLANSFSEDLGFTNVSVLEGGILQWLKESKKLFSHKKDY